MRRLLSADTAHHNLGVFVHIPKTGGLTLYWIIARQYTQEAIFTLDWTKHFDDSVREFTALPGAQQRSTKILRGQMRYALRTLLPDNAWYFTILRDPIKRIISYYQYVHRSTQHPWRQELHANNLTLYEFVTQIPDWNIDNCQTRFLADYPSWVEYGKCTADMLASAKQNVKNFSVVGITERFDETLIFLKQMFHWNYPLYFRQNVSQRPSTLKIITNKELQAVRERNALDIELYQYAKSLMEDRLCHAPLAFKKELLLFRFLNIGFQKCHPLYYALKRKVILGE